MWNMTARGVSFRAYSSGGARATVNSLDTSSLLSGMTGGIFAGEARKALEYFEPYGFTAAIINKNADGVAEAVMNFITGARGHALTGAISDRRYRPLGLKQGENAQHDDIGQMTLLRRTGAFLLSLDGQGGANAETPGADNKERMVSMRHVVKSKQPRTPMSGVTATGGTGQASEQSGQAQDFKHEGEQVNTEVRCTAQKVSIYDSETLIAVYDRGSKTWSFNLGGDFNVTTKGKVNVKADDVIIIASKKRLDFNGGGPLVDPFSVKPGGV
jgi:phage gp45-like